jgi:uncharacterized protein YndB with AHSA1/START domain
MNTNPELLRQWTVGKGAEMPVCEIDMRPGGKWRYVWRESDGSTMEMYGEIKEIVPGEKLVQTEKWGDNQPEALNTMVLTEENGKTTITTTVLYSSKEDRQAALDTGMLKGWSETYDHLEDYLRLNS